jgi:hypothetical protein
MRNKIIMFIAAIIAGGLLLLTFAPVREMSVISQNTSQMIAVTSNTSSYVSGTGNVSRYQDVQLFLLDNLWFIICMIILIVIIIMVTNSGKSDDNG